MTCRMQKEQFSSSEKLEAVVDVPKHVLVEIRTEYTRSLSLQNKVGCFNLRVVTMAADKLERQWL